MRGLISFAAFLLLAVPAMAQTGAVSGTVRDAETGEAILGANIIIEGTTIGAATDLDGVYTIAGVPPGTRTLLVTYTGYRNGTVSVNINAGQTAQVDDVMLVPGMSSTRCR